MVITVKFQKNSLSTDPYYIIPPHWFFKTGFVCITLAPTEICHLALTTFFKVVLVWRSTIVRAGSFLLLCGSWESNTAVVAEPSFQANFVHEKSFNYLLPFMSKCNSSKIFYSYKTRVTYSPWLASNSKISAWLSPECWDYTQQN